MLTIICDTPNAIAKSGDFLRIDLHTSPRRGDWIVMRDCTVARYLGQAVLGVSSRP